MGDETGPTRIGLAGEDHAHRLIAATLVDQAIRERIQQLGALWPEADQLGQARYWTGLAVSPVEELAALSSSRFYRTQKLYEDLPRVAQGRFFRTNRIGTEPAGEAAWFIDLYRLFALQDDPVNALVVLKDSDGDEDIPQQVERALEGIRALFSQQADAPVVCFGIPHQDAEGWLVACLRDVPPRRMAQAKRTLSFDPVRESHRLTAAPNQAPSDAKRVLRFLWKEEGDSLEAVVSAPVPAPDLEAQIFSVLTPERATTAHPSTNLPAFFRTLFEKIAPLVVPGRPLSWT